MHEIWARLGFPSPGRKHQLPSGTRALGFPQPQAAMMLIDHQGAEAQQLSPADQISVFKTAISL